ncbi:hypothetical protein H0H81_005780 [Sphagnurus paluster]|uniref:C2H2-type domain-containing protein n=1 Tax=Sphagnurus paluster TaxID=117069 RepID=A0A9P7FRA6_9AGAR|nr:hypothetical protein H0H81_005780 [Sphagnurus paluster]
MLSRGDDKDAPVLPPELERDIFELTARSYKGMAVVLTLVSRRVQFWIETKLYETITLSTRELSTAFLYTVHARPKSFFTTAVKSLCIPGDIRQEDALEVMIACQGVVNLAYWISDHRKLPAPFPAIASLRPQRLSINTCGLFGDVNPPDFSHAFFERVTHLEIVDWPWMTISLVGSRFELLPFLTHLALDLDRYDEPVMNQLRRILDTCHNLNVLMCLVPNERDVVEASVALEVLNDVGGKVVILADSEVLDNWEGSLVGGSDACQWTFAETIIAERRKKVLVMDLMMDMNMNTTPRPTSDATVAQYFGEPANISNLSWDEADHRYDSQAPLELPQAPPLGSWTDEDMREYLIDNHPRVAEDHELELAFSDHSNAATSESKSHGSSHSHSTGESQFAAQTEWQGFSVALTGQGHAAPPPHLQLANQAAGFENMTHRDSCDALFMQASLDINQTVNPATFNEMMSNLQVNSRPSPLSSSSSSLPPLDPPFVPISDLHPPYIPNQVSDARTFPSHEAPKNFHTRKRSRGTKARARGVTKGQVGRGEAKNVIKAEVKPSSSSRTKRRTPSFSSSEASDGGLPISKRPRRSVVSKLQTKEFLNTMLDDGESDADGSDVYTPSRSPSPDLSWSDFESSPVLSRPRRKFPKGEQAKKALPIGAADALAQFSRKSSTPTSSCSTDLDGEWDSGASGSGSKKNRTIPLPVPVPNLIKSSRGRKVPYVNIRAARGLPIDIDAHKSDDEGKVVRGGASRRGRGGAKARGLNRTFVCTVAGCGKCFVRGEHLKRHVRSIHTNEKRSFISGCSYRRILLTIVFPIYLAYPCPYNTCDKSFSRRDNLGQHVRLHLLGPT